MWWLKPSESDLEVGLCLLEKDSDVLEMVKAALGNGNKIEIYFEDCIALPDILAGPAEGTDGSVPQSADEEGVLGDSVGSSYDFHMNTADEYEEGEDNGLSSDSYDSVEDESYKPPPPGVDDETEDELYEEDEPLISLKKSRYGYNSEELKTPPSSGDEEVERVVFPKFNEENTFGHVQLELGMEFVSLEHFKNGVKDYNISLGRQFKWVKYDKVRPRAKCSNEECDWMIYCAWNNKFNSFQVKTFNDSHSCCRIFKNKRASKDWVLKKLKKKMVTQPNMTRVEAYEHLKEEYKVHVHLKKVTKALRKAKGRIEGCEKEWYAKLRDYLTEILRSNPGSICQMQVIPQPVPNSPPIFSKLYICLDACKKGFKAGCRPLIGLDGCFLKGYYGGQLLSAVGEDANKSFYVIAYAVVDSETKENWKWFLNLLQKDIGSHVVHGWYFISDQQKGLIPALQEVMPGAHHRFCVQHVWKNFIKQWKDKAIRGIVWEATRCTVVPQFQRTMQKLKDFNEDAWAYLHKIDLSCWDKAYFSHWPKCGNITNNLAEVWNAKIVGYRSKLIIRLCEELRCYIMRRMAAHQRILGTVRGKIAPAQQKKLGQLKALSNSWTPTWTANLDQDIYEVAEKGERVGVNLTYKTCACNLWQLTGLPCEHAIAAICHKNELAELPIGRPKKHRKKDPSKEHDSKTKRLKRTYADKCGQPRHYAKTCKGPAASKKGKRAAPPSAPVNVNIPSRPEEELPLSQGGRSVLSRPSQAVDESIRGNSPPPTAPPPPEVLSSETLNATSSGTRSRLMAFMTTPGFRPPRPA
ncbi:uncharacterized protein LOC133297302 [Gastrolobium bilobum]|uniref:uncharacterized protein LOC133297302 n=1 Tax=Gastrolobium bilobum TaxID=150636 RepID=UPI002AB1EF99|nr:uncharacterized protein LOC133297302 [Gastrolobium bilobum]